jgi:hypothetical protein
MLGDVETMAAGTLPGVDILLPAPAPAVGDDDDVRRLAAAGTLADDDDPKEETRLSPSEISSPHPLELVWDRSVRFPVSRYVVCVGVQTAFSASFMYWQ